MNKKLQRETGRVNKIMSKGEDWYYWYGYSTGLKVDDSEEIRKWSESDSPDMRNVCEGFKAAQLWKKNKSGPGRPKTVEVWMNRIGVKKALMDKLAEIAVSKGVSLVEVRKQAYNAFVRDHGKNQ